MRLGVDCCLYRNTATIGPGWAAPTWNLVDGVKDVDTQDLFDLFENTIRRARGLKTNVPTIDDSELNLLLMIPDKVLYGTSTAVSSGNPDFDDFRALQTAKRTKRPLDMMILDGPHSTNGVEGGRFFLYVAEFSEPQANSDGLMMKVKMKPGLPDETTLLNSPAAVPSLHVRVTGGVPTFSLWEADTFTYVPTDTL